MAITVTHSKTLAAPDSGTEDKVYGSDYVSASSHTLNGFGTGVATALGVNVGTAGSVVVNGGALGTPSSGNLANCTGYPASTPAYPLTITGGVSGALVYASSTTQLAMSALLAANGVVLGAGAGAAPFTSANLTFDGTTLALTGKLTATVSIGAGSSGQLFRQDSGAHGTFILTNTTGDVSLVTFVNGSGKGCITVPSDGFLSFSSGTANAYDTQDACMGRGGANQIIYSNKVAGPPTGAATSRAAINKSVTGIADNTATAVFTVTVPNAAHSASIRVRLTGSMGAGGAIGANEANQDAMYEINVARTAGVNAVATIGAVIGQAASAAVAGAATVAVTGEISAISGAVGATNTFTINVKIVKSGGAAANHTCLGFAELMNANTSGVTIA